MSGVSDDGYLFHPTVQPPIMSADFSPRSMRRTNLSLTLLFIINCGLLSPVAAFSDLPESHPHHFALSYLEGEGVIQGYSDGTVRPDADINRAELIKILVEGQLLLRNVDTTTFKNCFPDVGEEWFAKYVCFAATQDWVAGYPDGTFHPEQTVNKVESLKIIVNSFGLPITGTGSTIGFMDVETTGWYMPFLTTALDKNILEEKGKTKFSPAANRSRGAVAEVISRIMQLQYMDDAVYSDTIRAEFQTWMLLNKLRQQNGVSGNLELNPLLTKSARVHARDMAEKLGQLSHTGSDGSNSWDRIRAAGFAYTGRSGENIGRGITSASRSIYKAILDVHNNIFMPEPDGVCNHRTTILSTCLDFKQVGVGVYVKDGYMYFAEDFVTDE